MTHFIIALTDYMLMVVGFLTCTAGVLWSGIWLIERILRAIKIYGLLLEYLGRRRQFTKWLKDREEVA